MADEFIKGFLFFRTSYGFIRDSPKPRLVDSGTDFLRFDMTLGCRNIENLTAHLKKLLRNNNFLLMGNKIKIKHRITNYW